MSQAHAGEPGAVLVEQSAIAGYIQPNDLPYRGTVVDESGAPVAGAEVFTLSDANRFRVRGRSAADGSFTLPVIDGNRGLPIVAQDSTGRRSGIFPTSPDGSYPPETTADAIRVVMKKSREVRVIVRDGQGQPIADATVAVTVHFDRVDVGTTDKNGEAILKVPVDARLDSVSAIKAGTGIDYRNYRFPGVPARNPGSLDQYHNEPIVLVLDGVRRIQIRLVDDRQQPLAGVPVLPTHIERPERGGSFELSTLDQFELTTDATGGATWEFPGDLIGKVSFFTKAQEYFREGTIVFEAASPDNDVTGVLLPTVEVRGTVTLPDGRPAPEIDLQVSGASYNRRNYEGRLKCRADGSFSIRVPPDAYYAFVTTPGVLKANTRPLVSTVRTQILRLREPAEPLHFVLQPGTRVHGVATSGKKQRPLSKLQVRMLRQDDGDYPRLPEGKRLPNPQNDRKTLGPILVWEAMTDEQGRFEFFVPPGKYRVLGPDVQFFSHSEFRATRDNPPIVSVEAELDKDQEVLLHSKAPGEMNLTGRVVLAADPLQGVPRAKIRGIYGIHESSFHEVMAAADGRYQARRSEADLFLHATTDDGLLSGILAIDDEATEVDIPVVPTVAVRGRLVHDKTGEPLTDRQVDIAVRVERGRGWTNSFGGSAVTNASGEFTLAGLTPGWKYHLNLVTQRGNNGFDGMPTGWQTIGEVTPESVGLMTLGDLKLNLNGDQWTTGDSIALSMATYRPARDRLATQLNDARLSDRRVLLLATEGESELCRRFYEIYFG